MNKTALLYLMLLCNVIRISAQDIQFTQFYANPLYLNPAFAGSEYCPRMCINYRNQWPNLSGTYVTYSASYDQYISSIHGGLGVLVTSDNQARGTLKTTTASLIYSYNTAITRTFSIKAALEATYFQKSLDRSKLNFGDMIDPRRGFVWNTNEVIPMQNKSNVDFSAGILGYSKHYFFGVSADHLTQPDEGLLGPSRLPYKMTVHAGALIGLEKGNSSYISPNILYQQQANFSQLNLGVYFVKDHFVGGLWYRSNDAAILLIGLQSGNFKFGYSYDVTISRLANNTAGSHEISMSLRVACKKKEKRYRPVSCPSF